MFRDFFTTLGEFSRYSAAVLRRTFSPRVFSRAFSQQAHRVGVESLSVVNLCCFFIGLVLVLQTAAVLARYGAQSQVSAMLSVSFVREIGPVFAAVMFAGRIGTGISAEIGSMVVTEQIDAYRSFGVDPLRELGAPRVAATTLMLPALTVIGCVVGIFSGFVVGVLEGDVTRPLFVQSVVEALTFSDIASCLVKGTTFGMVIGLVATYTGFRTGRATEAVGLSTTQTMVRCVISILVVDLILTKLFLIGESL